MLAGVWKYPVSELANERSIQMDARERIGFDFDDTCEGKAPAGAGPVFGGVFGRELFNRCNYSP